MAVVVVQYDRIPNEGYIDNCIVKDTNYDRMETFTLTGHVEVKDMHRRSPDTLIRLELGQHHRDKLRTRDTAPTIA